MVAFKRLAGRIVEKHGQPYSSILSHVHQMQARIQLAQLWSGMSPCPKIRLSCPSKGNRSDLVYIGTWLGGQVPCLDSLTPSHFDKGEEDGLVPTCRFLGGICGSADTNQIAEWTSRAVKMAAPLLRLSMEPLSSAYREWLRTLLETCGMQL